MAGSILDTQQDRAYLHAGFADGTSGDLVAIEGDRSMKRLGIVAALLAVLFAVPSTALAQVKALYWTTSGFFGPFPITDLIPSVPKEKARDVTIQVSMWVIDHPKGLVLFDTGNNAAD